MLSGVAGLGMLVTVSWRGLEDAAGEQVGALGGDGAWRQLLRLERAVRPDRAAGDELPTGEGDRVAAVVEVIAGAVTTPLIDKGTPSYRSGY